MGRLLCHVAAICSSVFIVDSLAFPHHCTSTHFSEQLEAHLFSKIIVTVRGLRDRKAWGREMAASLSSPGLLLSAIPLKSLERPT